MTRPPSGRTYQDYLAFMGEDPWPVVEMDTVIGTVGGKVILSSISRVLLAPLILERT